MTATEAESAARDPEFKENAGPQMRRRARQKNGPTAQGYIGAERNSNCCYGPGSPESPGGVMDAVR